MSKRLLVFLAAMAGTIVAASLPPEYAMAQPAGTVCGTSDGADDRDSVSRADRLTGNVPDLAGRLICGMATAGDLPAALSARGRGGSFDVALTTSLRQIAAAERARRARRLAEIAALLDPDDRRRAHFGLSPDTAEDGFASWLTPTRYRAEHDAEIGAAIEAALDDIMSSANDPAAAAGVTEFDLWVDGTWSRVASGETASDLGLLHIGADYRHSGNVLIGLLGQFDWSDDEEADAQSTQMDGFGWMIGPYAAARLREHLIFDTSVAWGRSDNEVSPFGSDTDRWLVRGGLTGDLRLDSWYLTPGVSATYFEEERKSYADSLGAEIPSQTVSLGRFVFEPEAAYLYQPTADWLIRPQVGGSGIWTFGGAEAVDGAASFPDGDNDLRARVEGGISVTYADRYTLTGDVFYDGIGADDSDTYGGSLGIDVTIADGVLLGGGGFMTDSGADTAASYGANLRLKLQLP